MQEKRYQTNRVFTPSIPAVDTFVEREVGVNDQLVDALRTPGKQIVIYGHTGCGKTTLLKHLLDRTYECSKTTRCMKDMTYDNIILNGFDQLDLFFVNSKNTTDGKKISASVGTDYKLIKSQIQAEVTTQRNIAHARVVPPQLTAQRLAEFFGEAGCCWVLEDFHKINPIEKTKVAQMMKVFMDTADQYPEVKLIAVGAVGTGREVIEYDPEMRNRVSEVHVPLMNSKEIREIIDKGEQLLNLKFDTFVKDEITRFSSGLAAICHQLCLDICFSKGIYTTAEFQESISKYFLEDATKRYVEQNSDSFKAQLDKALRISAFEQLSFFQ